MRPGVGQGQAVTRELQRNAKSEVTFRLQSRRLSSEQGSAWAAGVSCHLCQTHLAKKRRSGVNRRDPSPHSRGEALPREAAEHLLAADLFGELCAAARRLLDDRGATAENDMRETRDWRSLQLTRCNRCTSCAAKNASTCTAGFAVKQSRSPKRDSTV